MSSECREVDEGTLDKICMCGVHSQSAGKEHYKRSVIFGEGV